MKHFPDLFPTSKEIDKFFEDIANKPTELFEKYPATDIFIDSVGDTHIEMAVTGFDKKDIKVELKRGTELVITGNKPTEHTYEGRQYKHKGIARRAFTRTFIVHNIESVDAQIENGILHITLEKKSEDEEVQPIEIH